MTDTAKQIIEIAGDKKQTIGCIVERSKSFFKKGLGRCNSGEPGVLIKPGICKYKKTGMSEGKYKITLNQFKELISGMTADEMIDMMPRDIIIRGNKYYMGTYGPSNKLPNDIYHLMYCCYENKQVLVSLYDEDTRGINQKMLLRLFENNHLSDYQLVQDSLQKNN